MFTVLCRFGPNRRLGGAVNEMISDPEQRSAVRANICWRNPARLYTRYGTLGERKAEGEAGASPVR